MTSVQSRALGRGLKATVQRTQERTVTTITIQHDERFSPHQILNGVKQALLVRGGLNAAHTSIEIGVGIAEMQAALAKYESDVQTLRQQLRAATMAQHVAPTSESKRWVKVREAADILGVNIQTIYRAINDGRISTQSSRVARKRNHMVDPTTYRKKPRPVAQPRKKSK